MTKIAGERKSIYETAPAGSIFVTYQGWSAFKVGQTVTVDGEQLGRVAATEYTHDDRTLVCALVPDLLYWHLKLTFGLKLEGWGELDAPLTELRIPCHDRERPGPRSWGWWPLAVPGF